MKEGHQHGPAGSVLTRDHCHTGSGSQVARNVCFVFQQKVHKDEERQTEALLHMGSDPVVKRGVGFKGYSKHKHHSIQLIPESAPVVAAEVSSWKQEAASSTLGRRS
jgi:hypothetical protein